MAVTENISFADCPNDKEGLEYCSRDGAWYDVDLSRHGDQLIIKYRALLSTFDEICEPGIFKAVEDINRFRDRFRPSSMQVQDSDCWKLIPGLKVCALYSFMDNDLRYYDAIINEVNHKEHSFTDGEVRCWCSFILAWQDGPDTGKLATTSIESVCFLQDGPLNRTLVEFIKMSRVKVMNSVKHSRSVPVHESTQGLELERHQPQIASQRLKDMSLNIQGRCPYALTIENLDQGISASAIMEFVHKETTVAVEAHIFPRLRTDPFTRSILKVHTEREFNKLLEFIENPNHVVVSSRSRPWMVTERFVQHDDKLLVGNTVPKMEYLHGRGHNNELRVIYSGTDEYALAKELKENFTEFNREQKQLLRRLAFEEEKITRQYGESRKRSRCKKKPTIQVNTKSNNEASPSVQ